MSISPDPGVIHRASRDSGIDEEFDPRRCVRITCAQEHDIRVFNSRGVYIHREKCAGRPGVVLKVLLLLLLLHFRYSDH